MVSVSSRDSSGFETVRSPHEAFDALAELGDDATILAGGTDVMAQFLAGQITPRWLLYIGRVAGFTSVDFGDDHLSLGPLVTHRTVSRHPDLAARVPALAEACATVGGWQTQEAGTVVGNICNASPAADTLPPLLTAGTIVRLGSTRGERALPLAEFVTGRRGTAAGPDEIVVGIELEPCDPHTGEVYLKVAPRTAMEVAVVGLAVRLSFADGDLTDARVVAGAVAPVPTRATGAETVLMDSNLSPAGVEEAGARLVEHIRPIDDARASASYRRTVTRRLLGRAVDIARRRAGQE